MNDLQCYLSANHSSRAMTVGQLREALEDFNEDTPVVFAYNYGDHWRTQVAEHIRDVKEATVTWSEYHRQPKVLDEDDEREDRATEDDGRNEGATESEIADHNARTMGVVMLSAQVY